MTGITTVQARQMAEAVTPPVAIAKNALGAWCVTLTEAELAMLLSNAVTDSSTRLLKALDGMDRGCIEPGFKGHENGYGELAGDELQSAREELAALVGHIAAVEVDEPEIPWVETAMPATCI
jgi:hypothetical protein